VRRESILLIWIGGFVLAAALYAIGPDRFFDACLNFLDGIDNAVRNVVAALGVQAYSVIRALAIAIYAVFALLAFLAAQRGHRGLWAFIVVTATFMILVWRPYAVYPTPISRWIAALALAVIAALVMTQRLMVSPPRHGGPPPYPPGGVS
jgi:hypothetical protein